MVSVLMVSEGAECRALVAAVARVTGEEHRVINARAAALNGRRAGSMANGRART